MHTLGLGIVDYDCNCNRLHFLCNHNRNHNHTFSKLDVIVIMLCDHLLSSVIGRIGPAVHKHPIPRLNSWYKYHSYTPTKGLGERKNKNNRKILINIFIQ